MLQLLELQSEYSSRLTEILTPHLTLKPQMKAETLTTKSSRGNVVIVAYRLTSGELAPMPAPLRETKRVDYLVPRLRTVLEWISWRVERPGGDR